MNVFIEISIIILIATAVSMILKILKQPFIVGYILTGIIAGPYFLNILKSPDDIELFSRIGITMLLFIVGLHLNPKVIKEVGKIAFITGLGQVIFTSIIGYVICIALGFSSVESLYIAIALTLSSTIIILKLLSDKGDIDTLYGKISIGSLLVQDLVATILLIGITTMAQTSGQDNIPMLLGLLLIKGFILSLVLFTSSRYFIPKISQFMASSPELLFLFSLSWGLGIAALFYISGFSVEIGALVAGVALAPTPFATEIGARMKPLRDFFILLFFILLGSQMRLESLGGIVLPTTILSIFVLVGNPIIVFVLMNLLGYKRKTALFAGLTMAQISEFSLILAALGVSVGHLTQEALSVVTLVGVITISGSTYLILYSEKIYRIAEPFIKWLEFRKIKNEKQLSESQSPEIILFGYDRVGSDFIQAIQKVGKPFLVVDLNPHTINRLKEENIPYAFGDAEDIEFLDEIGLSQASMVISTIPSFEINKLIVKRLSVLNDKAISIVISHNTKEARDLYESGATYVVMPHYLGAELASHMLVKHGIDRKSFLEEQKRHLSKLAKRPE